MKYKRRLIIIDAWQLLSNRVLTEQTVEIPQWIISAILNKKLETNKDDTWTIPRLEHNQVVKVGDYIIRDSEGSLSACNKEDFTKMYEAVQDIVKPS